PPRSTPSPYTTLFRSRLIDSFETRRGAGSGELIVHEADDVAQRARDRTHLREIDGDVAHSAGQRCGDDIELGVARQTADLIVERDRKSTRLNSSHVKI